MQSRRHEDYASESSYGRGRRNTDHVPDGYLMRSPHSKRSWSPRRMEHPSYSDRVLTRRRGDSMERRRLVDDGSRRIRSRSPPILEAKRVRPFYNDDWVVDRDLSAGEQQSRYDFFDHMDMKHGDVDSPTRNEFSYGRGSSRTAIIDDKFEGRRIDSGMGEMVSGKSAFTGLYRSTREVGMGPTSRPESSKDISSSSLNIGLEHPDKERFRYPDTRGSFSFDKYSSMKQYGEDGDKHMVLLRDPPYSNLPASRSKESMGASHLKDYTRTSPQKSRIDHLGYRNDIPLSRDNHPLNSSNTSHSHPLSPSRYEQRQHLDHGRDPYMDYNEDTGQYHRDTFSPQRTRHLDSLHLQPRIQQRDDYLYPSDDMYEKMDMCERVDYREREILKPNMLEHVTHRAEASDFSHRSRTSLDYLSLEKPPATHNIEKREHSKYLDPDSVHTRIGRKISREEEIPYMGMPQDHEIERVRVDYDYKHDVGIESHKERRRDSPRFLYEMERLRPTERTHRMEERHDLSPYDSSSRFMKRKYIVDDEENRIPITSRRHNQDFSDEEWIDEEWIDQETRGSNYTKRRDHDHDHDHGHGFSRRVDRIYDETEELMHDDDDDHHHPMKFEDKYAKGYSRSGGYNSNSHHQNKKHVLSKWKNLPRRSEIDIDNDNDNDMDSGGINQYEDWSNVAKSEPREDSQEFKQLVHDFFLSFTKKLNENSSVRRRYMEQGRGGSLFCIVCGRSLSKEFMDTQRLAMHAFMSRKVGLRAQHLALHKAICYMLGWNGSLPQETLRWFPEPLSSNESLAQKEDLIIWPPVVIVHNISILNNDSNGKGVGPTTIEELGQFLRGKRLSGGKVRLGKYANCSIMLVKFLGTFSGLQEAEKIHEYFVKNKHGRKYLEQIISGKGKIKDGEGENGNGDKEGERVVFGYMGIAEDLDKVDFDTKRKCSIKSKKEIKDIADAPVKAE
ncbi:unnamed protein product [Lactuca virosa]|uniref:XS domain-containing protein n=1 Tax=Lactuca virosa TaxID=75947 RepID=A0AAU9N8S3_9ASTR|nr:unnamed protein product [Lactuca virosa]